MLPHYRVTSEQSGRLRIGQVLAGACMVLALQAGAGFARLAAAEEPTSPSVDVVWAFDTGG